MHFAASAGRRTPSVADRNAQCAPASSEPVVPIGQCLLNRVGGREEERRRIEERSFDDTEIGDNLDAIMNNALGSTAVAESTARSEEPGPDSQDSSHSASPALSSSPSPSSLAASTARAAQASRAASLVSSESTSSEPQTTGDQNLHEEFGQHYRCVRRSIIRQGSSTTSKQVTAALMTDASAAFYTVWVLSDGRLGGWGRAGGRKRLGTCHWYVNVLYCSLLSFFNEQMYASPD